MSENREILERLRRFVDETFGAGYGSRTRFAEAMGIRPQSVNGLLNGRTAIGARMQARLRALGCDIEWLMTGKTRESEGTLLAVREDTAAYILPHDTPKTKKEKIKRLVKELNKLNETDIEKVEQVIKTIFPKAEVCRKDKSTR